MSANVKPTGEPIMLSLTRAEALVLFEWLASRDVTDGLTPEPEQTVLWRVEGQLEKMLPELFRPDYVAAVSAARAHVLVDRS